MSQFSSLSPAAAALERENVWQREAAWSATTGAAISEANTKRFYAWSQDGFFKTIGKAALEGTGLYNAGPKSGSAAILNFGNDLFSQSLISPAERMGEDAMPLYLRGRDSAGRLASAAGTETPTGFTPRIMARAFYGLTGSSSFVPDDNMIGMYGADEAGQMLDDDTLLKLANATSEQEMAYIRALSMSQRDREQRFSGFAAAPRFALEMVGQFGDPVMLASSALAGGIGGAVGGAVLKSGAGTLARLEAGGLIARTAGTTLKFGLKGGLSAGENVAQGYGISELAGDDYTWRQASMDMAMGAGFSFLGSAGSAGKSALSKIVRGNQAAMVAEAGMKVTPKGEGFFVEVPGHRADATAADLRRADFGAATRIAEREGVPVGPDLQPRVTPEAVVLGRTIRTPEGLRAEIVARNGDTVTVRVPIKGEGANTPAHLASDLAEAEMSPQARAAKAVSDNKLNPEHVVGFDEGGQPLVKRGTSSSTTIPTARTPLKTALAMGRRVNAALLDGYNKIHPDRAVELPDGYVRDGDFYVKKGSPESGPAKAIGAAAPSDPGKVPAGLRDTAGWKLHLAVDESNRGAVSAALKEMGLRHKVGRSGGQAGKDITVYVGSKDAAASAAAKINAKIGDKLSLPYGDTLRDDASFGGKVMGRFDAAGDSTFHQYGKDGIPFTNDDMGQAAFDKAAFNPDEAKARADKMLADKYGAFYKGGEAGGYRIETHDVGQLMYDRSRVPTVGDKVRLEDGTLGTVRGLDGTGLAAVSRDIPATGSRGKKRGASSAVEYVPVSLLDEQTGPATIRKGVTIIDSAGRAIIGFLRSRDASTVVHETGHVFRRTLRTIDAEAADNLNKLLGEVDDNWSVQSEEKFARYFERYVAEGKAPTKSLAKAFASFRGWLTSLWNQLKGETPDQITPELAAIMDKLVDGNAVGPRARPGANYTRVRGEIINALGKNGQHTDLSSAMLALINANADAWSRAAGKNFDDYFSDVLVGVEKGNVTKERFMRPMLPGPHRLALITPDRRWVEISKVLAGEVHESTLTKSQWRMIRENGIETPGMRAWRHDRELRNAPQEIAAVMEAVDAKINQKMIDEQAAKDKEIDGLLSDKATDSEKDDYRNAAVRLQAEDPNAIGDGISKEQWDNIYSELTLSRLRLGEPDENGVRSSPNGVVQVVPGLNGAARIVDGRLQISPTFAKLPGGIRRAIVTNAVQAREVMMILSDEARAGRPVPRQSVAHIAAWMDRNGLMPAENATGVAKMVLHTLAESRSDHTSLKSLLEGGPEPLSPDDPAFIGSRFDPFAGSRTENVEAFPAQPELKVADDPASYVRTEADGPVTFIDKMVSEFAPYDPTLEALDAQGTEIPTTFAGRLPEEAIDLIQRHPETRPFLSVDTGQSQGRSLLEKDMLKKGKGQKKSGMAEDFIAEHGWDKFERAVLEMAQSGYRKALNMLVGRNLSDKSHPFVFADHIRSLWDAKRQEIAVANREISNARRLKNRAESGKLKIMDDAEYESIRKSAYDTSKVTSVAERDLILARLKNAVSQSQYDNAVKVAAGKKTNGFTGHAVHYVDPRTLPEGTTFTTAGEKMEATKSGVRYSIDGAEHVAEWPNGVMPIDKDSLALPPRQKLIEQSAAQENARIAETSAEYVQAIQDEAAQRDALAAEVQEFYQQERDSLAPGQDPLHGSVTELEQTSRPLSEQPIGIPGDVRVFDPKSIVGSKISGVAGKLAFGRLAQLLDSPSKFVQDTAAMLFNSPLMGESGTPIIQTADLFVERRVGEINGVYIGKVRSVFAKYAAENKIPLRQRSSAFNEFMRQAGDLAAQTNAVIADPHLKSVVDATREAIGQAHAVARANGVALPDYDPAYFTRLWSAGRKASLLNKLQKAGVADSMKEIHSLLQEAIQKEAPHLTPDEALKLAQVYADKIDNVSRESALSRAVALGKLENFDRTAKMLTDSGRFTNGEAKALASKLTGNPVTGRPANPTKGRTWKMDDRYTKTINTPQGPMQLSVADLLETRADHIVHAYTHSMVAEGAIQSTLNTLSARYGFPLSSTESLLQAAEREMRTAGMSDTVIRRQMLRLQTGINLVRGLPNHQGEFVEWARRLRMFNYIRKQAGFVTSAIFELGGVPSRASVGAMMKTMPLAREVYGHMKDGKMDSGLTRAVLASMGAGHEGQLRDYLPDIEDRNAPFTTGGDRIRAGIDDGLRRGVGMVSKGTGFQQVNDFSHIWARLTYMQHMADLARRDQSPSVHRLAQIGLTEPQWKEIAAELKNASSKSPGTGGLISDIDLDAFKSADARTRFLYAVDNKGRQLIQQNGIGQSDYWMETPAARLILQFRSFMINAWERQLLANVQQFDGESAAFFASSMAMGFLQYSALSYLDTRGHEDPDGEFKKRMEPQRAAVAAFSRAAFSGIAPTMIDTALVTAGYKPLGGFRASGLESHPLFGSPTWQLLGEGIPSATRLVRAGIDPTYDVSSADVSGARSLLPFHRFPGVMGVTNGMMQGLPKRPQKQQTDPLDWWSN